jgi:hypothetical protein
MNIKNNLKSSIENIQVCKMETKEELINNIKEWIKLDSEIAKLNLEIKERKMKKKSLNDALLQTMKQNKIDCFDINGGSLVYKQNKTKKPINAKNLNTILQTYYTSTGTPEKAEELTKYILSNREEQIKEIIKRKIDK